MQQIVRRIHEKQSLAKQKKTSISSPLKQPHLSGPVTNELGTCQQYNDGQTFISCCKGDNCFSVGGRILIGRNILLSSCDSVKVLCSKKLIISKNKKIISLRTMTLFSATQLTLHALEFTLFQTYPKTCNLLVEELRRKMVLLPYKTGYVALPQLH